MATTGIDTTLANAVLNALLPASGTQTVGTLTITGPIHCRFDSVITTSGSSASTEWTGGGYPATGVPVTAWNAAAGGSKASNVAVTVTSAPATTWAGNELWDNSATPQRLYWGAISGGSKTVNSGDTCTIAAGSLTVTSS